MYTQCTYKGKKGEYAFKIEFDSEVGQYWCSWSPDGPDGPGGQGGINTCSDTITGLMVEMIPDAVEAWESD